MPGKQSATPRPLPRSRSRHRFTLELANRSLPLVRRIAGDIVAAHARCAEVQTKLAALPAGKGKEAQAVQRELEEGLTQLQGYVDELTEIGCELKDYQTGLVDFIGRHQGRDVCLCWRVGEERIGYWHELHTGVAGRQPIATLEETA